VTYKAGGKGWMGVFRPQGLDRHLLQGHRGLRRIAHGLCRVPADPESQVRPHRLPRSSLTAMSHTCSATYVA
jgi:hypothetical protein